MKLFVFFTLFFCSFLLQTLFAQNEPNYVRTYRQMKMFYANGDIEEMNITAGEWTDFRDSTRQYIFNYNGSDTTLVRNGDWSTDTLVQVTDFTPTVNPAGESFLKMELTWNGNPVTLALFDDFVYVNYDFQDGDYVIYYCRKY